MRVYNVIFYNRWIFLKIKDEFVASNSFRESGINFPKEQGIEKVET